jgi:valyl-tRNA synthetase
LSKGILQLERAFGSYRISEALMTVYRLFWDEFASWYLELVKPGYQKPVDAVTARRTDEFFDILLRLLHPFMPFITEEIWHLMDVRADGQSIMNTEMPKAGPVRERILREFEDLKEVVASLRTIRKEREIPARQPLRLLIMDTNNRFSNTFRYALNKLGNLAGVEQTGTKAEGAVSFRVRSVEFFVPLDSGVDHQEELRKLQEELEYTRGFLEKVKAKLHNEQFMNHAPAKVVEKERKKQADAELTIKTLRERIRSLEQ